MALQVLLLGMVFMVFSGGPGCWFAPHPDHFVQEVWADADPNDDCGTRYEMVDDLLANHLRPGMTRQEVVALLGTPDDPEYGYMLGCFIDCNWVRVEFDATDRLIEARQYQD